MIFSLLVVLVEAGVSPQCSRSVSAEEMDKLLKEGEAAFASMDIEGFDQRRLEVHSLLPCVKDSLSAGQIAHLHRVEFLNAFAERDMARLGAHARAAHLANPELPITEGMVQSGHPLDVLGTFAVLEATAPTISLPRPIRGQIRIDGRVNTSYPPDLPYVFQMVSADGQALQTQLVALGEPVPQYNKWKGEILTFDLEPRLTMAAGGAAAIALGTASWAYFTEQRFWNPSTENSDLVALQKRSNRLTTSSLLFGSASAGLFIAASVTGSW